MYLLGIDIGSSFVKASVIESETGVCKGAASHPASEMTIHSPMPGFAEQHPDSWWENSVAAVKKAYTAAGINPHDIVAIGISYQMHGLVCLDKNNAPLRPAIIWCDGRAVEIGQKAFDTIGKDYCFSHMLNSPGNFTASKLAWIKQNEKETFSQTKKICLPGDFVALKLTGKLCTTVSGLSEGIFWDFSTNKIANELLNYYGIAEDLLPPVMDTFGMQGTVTDPAAQELGIKAGTPVSYRAGDQPNNAFSLNVLDVGDVAATAGTSGVVYGITDTVKTDPESRINVFAHVNHAAAATRLGLLLCISGTGIANSWVKRMAGNTYSYDELNNFAQNLPIGSDGLVFLPFGNGAERVLKNKDIGAQMQGITFNRHTVQHIGRAVQEGIAFSFKYGIDIMAKTGFSVARIRAGKANLFLSKVFRETLASIVSVPIELYNTDGAQGAARGAGMGIGIYKNNKEAFNGLKLEETTVPDVKRKYEYQAAYGSWLNALDKKMQGL